MSVLKVITADAAQLILAPELGGGIARLDVDNKPVLRPWSGDRVNPFSLASNVLIPFSNRISGGGFVWNGVNYPLEPNLDNEAFPMHGDGFQKVWDIVDSVNISQSILFSQPFLPNSAIFLCRALGRDLPSLSRVNRICWFITSP